VVCDAYYAHFLNVDNKELEILQEEAVKFFREENVLEVNDYIKNTS
jgi:hypothetical protein